jgi:formate hydrogenlyase transcriptional activator
MILGLNINSPVHSCRLPLKVATVDNTCLAGTREDILPLVNHFVAKFAQRMGKDIRFVSRNAMEALTNAAWKGNARELGNFMERCVILTQGEELNVPHLEVKDSAGRKVVPVASSFQEAERRVIIDALSDASGRIAGKGGGG